jgi:hypothetical protein
VPKRGYAEEGTTMTMAAMISPYSIVFALQQVPKPSGWHIGFGVGPIMFWKYAVGTHSTLDLDDGRMSDVLAIRAEPPQLLCFAAAIAFCLWARNRTMGRPKQQKAIISAARRPPMLLLP